MCPYMTVMGRFDSGAKWQYEINPFVYIRVAWPVITELVFIDILPVKNPYMQERIISNHQYLVAGYSFEISCSADIIGVPAQHGDVNAVTISKRHGERHFTLARY